MENFLKLLNIAQKESKIDTKINTSLITCVIKENSKCI